MRIATGFQLTDHLADAEVERLQHRSGAGRDYLFTLSSIQTLPVTLIIGSARRSLETPISVTLIRGSIASVTESNDVTRNGSSRGMPRAGSNRIPQTL